MKGEKLVTGKAGTTIIMSAMWHGDADIRQNDLSRFSADPR